jgi:branched-chain amino acid transport system permease protein
VVIVVMQALVVGLLTGGLYGLFAVGLSLIMGVANIMTFVHGDFLMIAMYLTLGVVGLTGWDPYATMIFVVPAMYFLALVTYRYFPAVKRIIEIPQMKQMLYMLGFSYFIQNVVLVALGAKFHTINTVASKLNMTVGGVFIAAPRLIAGLASIIITLGLMWFLKNTDLGRSIRAASQDRDAAAMMGINVNRTYLFAWAIGLATLGIAGPLFSPIFPFHPTVGNYYLMIGFMCVVLGGLGNVVGALVGGIVMGVALELGNVIMPGSSGPVLPFLVFVAVLLFKPEGLFGEAIRGGRQ